MFPIKISQILEWLYGIYIPGGRVFSQRMIMGGFENYLEQRVFQTGIFLYFESSRHDVLHLIMVRRF